MSQGGAHEYRGTTTSRALRLRSKLGRTIERFEWRDGHPKSYREFCVPAQVMNTSGATVTAVIENFMTDEASVSAIADWPADVRKGLGPLVVKELLATFTGTPKGCCASGRCSGGRRDEA